MSKTWYGLGLLLGLIILILRQSPSEKLRIVACDVGQGDAILLTKGYSQVVVDGGPSGEQILACLTRHLPFWDRTIELIVMTNTDYDHMNGLSAVIERYQVMQFVTSDGVHESEAIYKLIAKINDYQIPVSGVGQGDIIRVRGESELELKVLWPSEVNYEYVAVFGQQMDKERSKQILGASAKRGDLNERSVVLSLLEDNQHYLLMGDAGFQTEKALLESGLLTDVYYLKVGHHGSKYASSLDFLETIMPEIAVISAGQNNRYGHPTTETLGRLEEVGAEIRRTDREGEIVLE